MSINDFGNTIGIVFISFFVAIIVILIVTEVIARFGKEKIRDIRIVRTRKTKRDLPYDPKTHTGTDAYYTFENTTVDFVYIGKKHVHTYFCDEHLYKRLSAGHTYKVALRYPHILYIVNKNTIDKTKKKRYNKRNKS